MASPAETIDKFNDYSYPPSQLFLERENDVPSREPSLDRTSPEFSAYVCLQLSEIFTYRTDSFTTSDLVSFCARIRATLNQLIPALGDIPRFRPIYNCIQEHENLFRAIITESVLYSSLPRKMVNAVDHVYVPPHNEHLIPLHFSRACMVFPCLADPARDVTAHPRPESFSHPTHSPDRRAARSPPPSPACAPPRKSRDSYPSRSSGTVWVPPPGTCHRCLRDCHRTRDCRQKAYCPYHNIEGHRWDECRAFPDRARQTRHALDRCTSNRPQ